MPTQEAPGVEPVFAEKRQAINYAENRASSLWRDSHLGFGPQENALPLK
jgi:hypothetical protein